MTNLFKLVSAKAKGFCDQQFQMAETRSDEL